MSDVQGAGYQVMARRHRPQRFDELVGQDFLVRVLSNAFARGQLPHAIMLTGVRGVGKTTTARIVAKGLNCASVDQPTITPCGECEICRAIAASRHIDVLEMDAASRTGIDDIREIIDSVAYRAAEARYKVYIIDEVHMLSKNAFNGLLKTLEEPPEHVVFILATTDIEKVPVTVLSRCMRFDLRRVGAEVMTAHLADICGREDLAFEKGALTAIARASEGSVRDALSLLDQAAAGAGEDGLTEAAVRDMLGATDRAAVFALFEQVMAGDAAQALASLGDMVTAGADPVAALRDLGETTHLVTIAKTVPARAEGADLTPVERELTQAAAAKHGVRALGRLWQMTLKALEEAAIAPSSFAAAEMALIRMCHVSTLPTPDDLLRRLESQGAAASGAPSSPAPSPAAAPSTSAATEYRAEPSPPPAEPRGAGPRLAASLAPARPQQTAMPKPQAAAAPLGLDDFDAIVALIRQKRDGMLLFRVERHVRPGSVRDGAFEFTPAEDAPADLAAELGRKLSDWTGRRWMVSVADGHSTQTLAERRAAEADALRAKALAHPLVQAALAAFPDARLTDVRELGGAHFAPLPDEDDALLEPVGPGYDDDL